MRLYFIRHAESVGNQESRLQGRREFPLTENGHAQAHATAKRLAGAGLAAVYTSPLLRTHQTAEIIAKTAGLKPVPEIRLQEYDFGDEISGQTWEDIRHKHPDIIKALSTNDSDFPRYPGEEGRANFRTRVTEAISEIIAAHADPSLPAHPEEAQPSRRTSEARTYAVPANIAIVTHAGPIVVYVLDSLGRRYSRPIPIAIDNASITTVEIDHPGNTASLIVTGINDTCHLRHRATGEEALDVRAAG